MARRLFDDNGWTDEANSLAREMKAALQDILVEAESAGRVDLRDFHFVATTAASEIVLHNSISRRLEEPEANPKGQPRGERGTQGGEWDGENLLTPEQLASLEA